MTQTIKTAFLEDIEPAKIISLMNNELVARYLPLLKGKFTEQDCQMFVKSKQ